MDYRLYENSIPQPKIPKKPILPLVPTPNDHRKHADSLEQYEKELIAYKAEKENWEFNEKNRLAAFKIDALKEVGLYGHEAADRAFAFAWEEKNKHGLSEVFIKLCDIAIIILGDSEATLSPNPMRELILTRIEVIQKNHKGFSKNNMRWDVTFYGVYICDIYFAGLPDDQLLEIFEFIIRRMSLQM